MSLVEVDEAALRILARRRCCVRVPSTVLGRVLGELSRLRALVALYERTRTTGGPPPPDTHTWDNERHVEPPESASDERLALPAHLVRRRAET